MNKALAAIKLHKIVILIICFALASIFIYRRPSSQAVKKQVQLSQALTDIKGWTVSGYTPLDLKIVDALELDDYANQSYSDGNDIVSLYIGYYLTAKKVGAAHDPLVCFPGQGWEVSDRQKGKIVLNPRNENSISYSSMIVQRGSQKELIVYWFQSYDKANPNTLSQKANLFWKRLLGRGEGNAFVRITTSIGEKSLAECQENIFKFVKVFYPIFLNYIRST